ncbi:unnamed protein product [Durusdinium trenchii]|uniref:Uncharacterized protein n=1 Tax=Durusdinium trenchii TaxID=1381693 RepID=A0ABP0JN91_9DINO
MARSLLGLLLLFWFLPATWLTPQTPQTPLAQTRLAQTRRAATARLPRRAEPSAAKKKTREEEKELREEISFFEYV